MANVTDLDPTTAQEQARRLKTIDYFLDEYVDLTAEDLIHWCHGGIADNIVYSPAGQARWLVREARETWRKWLGTGALKALFDGKFGQKLSANSAKDLGEKPPIECISCNDTGVVMYRGRHRYCDCDMGTSIQSEFGEERAKNWLRLMDRSYVKSFRPEPVRRPSLTNADLEAEYLEAQTKREPDKERSDGE
jgi:hypothetical protein